MKKLKLKIQDLENPSILTHREIKNILGGGDDWGSDSYGIHTCVIHYFGLVDQIYDRLTRDEAEQLKGSAPYLDGFMSIECDF